MPVNRNALIRHKTIDKCLQNRYRRWTLDDLIDACSDALYEYEGIDKGVSKRTVQNDIQIMRSDKLGYNAPITVIEKKYYVYDDPEYSITNIPLSDQDLSMLSEAVEFMKQFQGFSHFRELDGMVQKLEDHIYSQSTSSKPVIDFEKNENLKGLEFLDPIYRAIIKKQAVTMTYRSFSARKSNEFTFHPYLLKEFRNRWFVIGCKTRKSEILNLALDRIENLQSSDDFFLEENDFDGEKYYQDVIGVSVNPNEKPQEVIIFANHKHAPYIATKPFHPSQKEIERDNFGVTFSFRVQHNFELEKEILAFGEHVKVISPRNLKRKIKERLKEGVELYDTELNESKLNNMLKQLVHKGFCVFNYAFSSREIRRINHLLETTLNYDKNDGCIIGDLFNEVEGLENILHNRNLQRVLSTIRIDAKIRKASFVALPRKSEQGEWRQDKTDFTEIEALQNATILHIYLDDVTSKNGAIELLPASHSKQFSEEEISLISQNSLAYSCEMYRGSLFFMKPLLLHRLPQAFSQKMRRFVRLIVS